MQEAYILGTVEMNPAARYICLSDAGLAAPVPAVTEPSLDESGTFATRIWGITTYADVFALHVSLRIADEAREGVSFTPAMADDISMSIGYSNGRSAVLKLGSRSVGEGVAIANMESCITLRRIDAHVAVSPLPGPGDVHVLCVMGDGYELGEWVLRGETILDSSRTMARYDQA